jgi:uncharacterized glyoxalase superfamily protein PhnB
MASRLNPYLNFDGNARQALEFYASARYVIDDMSFVTAGSPG